jgi:hypothetical protein
MNGKQIAEIIAQQLGGTGRLKCMIGAKDFCYDSNDTYFAFKHMKGNDGINYCKIKLNGLDLYDLTFGKIRGHNYTIIKEINNIYNDQLKSIFEQTTKLYVSL